MNKPVYNVLEREEGLPYIQMVEPYTGVCFSLGKVSFIGTEEEPILEYNYDILEGRELVGDVKVFEKFVADLIFNMIMEKLEKGELLYSGGT